MVLVKQIDNGGGDEVEIFDEVIVGVIHVIVDINPLQIIILAEIVPFFKVIGNGNGINLKIVVVGEIFLEFIQFRGLHNAFIAVGIPEPKDNQIFVNIFGGMLGIADVIADQGRNGFSR